MVVSLAFAGLAGVLLGVLGRAPAIVVTSMLVLCIGAPIAIMASDAWLTSILMVFAVLATLQLGFISGLLIKTFHSKLRGDVDKAMSSAIGRKGMRALDLAK
ncbi:MAG: hypothetical protein NW215_09195 [Hyphomicrobiales bacterium]|nr:hypothetical protein [Hyphomicrobiales bacterium]